MVYTIQMNDSTKTKTIAQLFELLYAAMDYERSNKSYGTDENISSSEIYMIKCIDESETANVTTLAKELDVSKSAVSQAIKKLNKKGLVDIAIDADNQSRYVLSLTEKGSVAHNEHMTNRESMFANLSHILDGYDDETCKNILDFLSKCEDGIKDFV